MNKRFDETYRDILEEVHRFGYVQYNERTSSDIKAHSDGGLSFDIDLRNGRLPLPGMRKVFPHKSAAECAWFLSGDTDLSVLKECGAENMWEPFANKAGKIDNAYGYRWRSYFGRDQIRLALKALKDDSSSRQIFVSAWAPNKDGLGWESPATPCLIGFTLNVANDLDLSSTLFIRSSDLVCGLPYDIMTHTFLLHMFAVELELDLANLHVTIAHPHIYRQHHEVVDKMLRTEPYKAIGKKINHYPHDEWISSYDAIVSQVKRDYENYYQPPYIEAELVL